MDQVVNEMGPVEGTDGDPDGTAPGAATAGKQQAGRAKPKRLYRIRDGQMVAGVCNGLAAYFNVDVTLVRIPCLLLVWTGVGMLAYFALMVIIPYADTPEEQAAASGQPFNAQELIDSIKRHAADFKDHGKWSQQWKDQKRQWRAEHRAWRQQWRHTMREQRWWGPPAPVGSYRAHAWAGLLMPVFSLISLACVVLLALSILSLVDTGALYGWPLPNDVPLWEGVKRTLNAFLRGLWTDGALAGTTPDQAFYVKCDAETNPPESVDAGKLIVEVGLAPSKPAEFVIFRIAQHKQSAG